MLSRAASAIAFQKVVSQVSDLPSPLDAEPGTRIIVRETEDVYGLNAETRMWSVIGTLKKVGGKKPEELAAHCDAKDNPHGTTLQQVLDGGTEAKVTQEIVIGGKTTASQLRLLSGGAALRVGPDAGNKDGVLWINTGAGKKTILRAVNSDGTDTLVLDTTGLVSAGSATFHGGFKGAAHFEDEITADEGVHSAQGYDLVLGGDKGVMLRVGGQDKAILTERSLDLLNAGLSFSGDLTLGGLINSSLVPNPTKKVSLGTETARWESAAIGDLDLSGSMVVRVPANSKAPPIQVMGPAPGNAVVITPDGKLGLGTDAPEARLDVCGPAIIGIGKTRLSLNERGISCDKMSVKLGDTFVVDKGGTRLIELTESGVRLGPTQVTGDLNITGSLQLDGVSGPNRQTIRFNKSGTSYTGDWNDFFGAINIKTESAAPFSVGETLYLLGGNVLGSGSLGSAEKAWKTVFVDQVAAVGRTFYADGSIQHETEFSIASPILSVGPELRLGGATSKLVVDSSLQIGNKSAGMTFHPGTVLSFSKPTKIDGVSALSASQVSTKALVVDGPLQVSAGGRAVATLSAGGIALTGGLNVGGFALKKVEETLEFAGPSATTKFKVPAGVRVEAVVIKVVKSIEGARFLSVGDASNPDRFAGPFTNLRAGSLIRGMNHCDRGQSVQRVEGPVVVSADAPAFGEVLVTVFYTDPAAL
jgi:hypothetical protein